VKEDLSSFTQAVDKIKDGNLHATLITAGTPTAAVTDFAQSHALKVIPLSGPRSPRCRSSSPTTPTSAAGQHLQGPDRGRVDTLAVMAVWTTHDGVPDNVAYEVTKACTRTRPSWARCTACRARTSPGRDAGFVYDRMQRRIGVLHMRVDPAQAQTLRAVGGIHPLTRWGATGLRLETSGCD
jgi:hypothetical protein